MNHSTVANTYARALLPSDLNDEGIELRMNDLAFAFKTLSDAESARKFFSSPQILTEDKQALLEKTLKGIDRNVLNLLLLLIEKNRFDSLKGIVKESKKIVDGRLNTLEGTLTTAMPVDAEDLKLITKKLTNRYKKTIHLKTITDPSLIAGGVLIIAHEMIDFSAKGKLDNLKNDLMEMTLEKRSPHET